MQREEVLAGDTEGAPGTHVQEDERPARGARRACPGGKAFHPGLRGEREVSQQRQSRGQKGQEARRARAGAGHAGPRGAPQLSPAPGTASHGQLIVRSAKRGGALPFFPPPPPPNVLVLGEEGSSRP